MPDRPAWILRFDKSEKPLLSDEDWGEWLRQAAAGKWGIVTAQRVGSVEKLILRFNESFGLLEHWSSDEGPALGARFPNRSRASETRVELPCCGCLIPLSVPDRNVLRKPDAIRLALQFLHSGVLPHELAEAPQEAVQLLLPGLEEFVVPPAVLNAVGWEPL